MSNNIETPNRVGETQPSRPGLKFVLCVVVALAFVAFIILRG